MDVHETLDEVREAMAAKGVYGEPYDHDGVTIIPAAAVRGGGGGGADESGHGGAGFGVNAIPKGAWVIRGDRVTWRAAVDVNRVILGGQLVGIAALLTAREVVKLMAIRSAKEHRATLRLRVPRPHRAGLRRRAEHRRMPRFARR
jgi:hypothetical protein